MLYYTLIVFCNLLHMKIIAEFNMKQIGKVACLVFLAALLSACQSTPEGEGGVSSEINTEDAFQGALKTYRFWRDKLEGVAHLEVYSPDKYAQMMSSWQKADSIFQEFRLSPAKAFESYSLFSSTTYLERFNEEILIVENSLAELKKLKQVADDILEPAITQLNYLNSIDARRYYRSEYARLSRFYAKLFRLVEEDEESDALEEQEEFLERAHSLEIRTIKKIYIAPLADTLRELRRNDVKYYAPISYGRAEADIEAGKVLIERSPRAFTEITKAVIKIKFELAHAEHIALEVQGLRDRSKDEYESFILDIENKLLQISLALNDSDLRNQPLKNQAAQIKNEVMVARRQNVAVRPRDNAELDEQKIMSLAHLVSEQKKQIEQLEARLASLSGAETASQGELNGESVSNP